MTNTVELNGKTYTDGSSSDGGVKNLGNGGHRINFIPMLTDTLVEVGKAADWAVKTDGSAGASGGTDEYSAKAYAVGGSGVDDAIGSAKDWAVKGTTTVDGTEYSAKHHAGLASASAGAAGTSASNAEGFKNDAVAQASAAAGSASAAQGSATLAQQWADKTDGVVDGDYSAKAFALGGVGVSDTAGGGAAKEWATKSGATVDGSEFSAKEYAAGTMPSGGSAKEWATKSGASVDGGEFSAKEYAAGTMPSGGSAKEWATKSGASVDGGEFSAKEYAAGATLSGGSAKAWAIHAEDSPVPGTAEFSAYHWAQKAQGFASNGTLAAIAAELDATASVVDYCIYIPAIHDSDGGAKMLNGCSHTSWYNEPSNTATRGGRRGFPAVALIVAEADKVTIYDATDLDGSGDPRMWMVFTRSTSGSALNLLGWSAATITSVAMVNGELWVGTTGGQQLSYIGFAKDEGELIWENTSRSVYKGSLAQRNDGLHYGTIPSGNRVQAGIVNREINDLAMTVLKDAPIDPDSGLAVPTIAVATDGGVSVITHHGDIHDLTCTQPDYNAVMSVAFVGDQIAYEFGNGSGDHRSARISSIPDADLVVTTSATDKQNSEEYYAASYWSSGDLALNSAADGTVDCLAAAGDRLVVAGRDGVNLIQRDTTTPANGMLAYLSSSVPGHWLPGDVRGSWLASTDATDIGVDESVELLSNGSFDTDLSGWTDTSTTGSISWNPSGYLSLNDIAGGQSSAAQLFATEAGKNYEVTVDVTSVSTNMAIDFGTSLGGYDLGSNIISTAGTYVYVVTAQGASTSIRLYNGSSSTPDLVNSVSVRASGERVTNGSFMADTSGWSASASATISLDAQRLKVLNTAGQGGNAYAYQAIACEIGKTYLFSVDLTVSDTGSLMYVGTSVGVGDIAQRTIYPGGKYSLMFTAPQTTVYLRIGMNTTTENKYSFFDNVSVRLADEDRSARDTGMVARGIVAKSAVGAGSDLVAYSGFSASNYLEQPYNPGLDFGTGDFCFMGWAKRSGGLLGYLFRRLEYTGPHDSSFGCYVKSDGTLVFEIGLGDDVVTTNSIYDDRWHHITCRRSNGTLEVFVDGESWGTATNTNTVTGGYPITQIGNGVSGAPFSSGHMALWRATAHAPSEAQIKTIHESEKHHFGDGALCTLSASQVTALAYDEVNDQIHVGSAAGRDVLAGLSVVERDTTTTAITALAACDGIVGEGS